MNESGYKKHIKDMYGLDDLKLESPQEVRSFLNRSENDLTINTEEAKKIEKEWTPTGIFKYKNNNLRIFEKKESSDIFMSLLAENQPYIILMHDFREFKLNNKIGISSLDIWSDRIRAKELARYWIFNYILKKYDFIVSDRSHTSEGKSFWIKLIDESLKNNLYVFVYHYRTKELTQIRDKSEIENYYGTDKSAYQFIISNENLK